MARRRTANRPGEERASEGRPPAAESTAATSRPGRPRPVWCDPLLVFLLALAVRLLHLAALRTAPFFHLRLGDAASYDAWGLRLAAGDWLGSGIYYQSPLYPWFLGALYSTFGHSLTLVRAAQALLGAGASVLVLLAGRRLFGARAGLVAGLLLAFAAPAIFFDGLIQKASLDLALTSLLLLLMTETRPGATRIHDLGLGFVTGLLALNRENALLLLPVVVLYVWRRERPAGRHAIAAAAVVAGLLLVLAPVALRNRLVGGELHLTTAQFGPNFYIGNHAGASGIYEPLRPGRGDPEFEQADARELAERAAGHPLTPGEVSSFWRGRAFAWIEERPLQWFGLLGRKLLLVWNAAEIMDTEDLATHAERSPALRWTAVAVHFGVLAPLGLLGLWLSRARRRELWQFYAILGVYSVSVALFYVLSRYRFPLLPLLAIFAGTVVARSLAEWRRAGAREMVPAVALLLIATLLCNWPLVAPERMSARSHANIARALAREGRSDEAVAEYRRSLELVPDDPAVLSDLGALLDRKGERAEALRHLEEAVELDPGSAKAAENLGVALAEAGRRQEAIDQFRRALTLDPASAGAHFNLARALAEAGQRTDAVRHLLFAADLDPASAEVRNNLGVLLAGEGRIVEAIHQFRAAIGLEPGFREARANLARAEAILRESRISSGAEGRRGSAG